ncbi:hypothetical protein AAFN60_15125 [Roseibacillus persicicus]|uniref:hypothetical protein n=1 Tax=Roseibacillus persicicus TaxID=454148 RepID=UPI00398BBA16
MKVETPPLALAISLIPLGTLQLDAAASFINWDGVTIAGNSRTTPSVSTIQWNLGDEFPSHPYYQNLDVVVTYSETDRDNDMIVHSGEIGGGLLVEIRDRGISTINLQFFETGTTNPFTFLQGDLVLYFEDVEAQGSSNPENGEELRLSTGLNSIDYIGTNIIPGGTPGGGPSQATDSVLSSDGLTVSGNAGRSNTSESAYSGKFSGDLSDLTLDITTTSGTSAFRSSYTLGVVESEVVIPEPSTSILALFAAPFLLRRRR